MDQLSERRVFDHFVLEKDLPEGNGLTSESGLGLPLFGRSRLIDQGIQLGGLFENDVAKAKAKPPLLGDIPLLGQLFRNTTKEDRKTELLIFVTPRVILAEEE